MARFGCDCVRFVGFLLCRIVIAFVHRCQCYCFGDGYIVFVW